MIRAADTEPDLRDARVPWTLWQIACSTCGGEFRRTAPWYRKPAYCSPRCARQPLKLRDYALSQAQRGER